MNKFISFIASLSILFATVAPAYAMEGLQRPPGANYDSSQSAQISGKVQESTANRVTKLNDRAVAEIDRRVAALQKLITLLSNVKRLTADQKVSFTTQIQAEITSLQTLEAKIKLDTDITTLKTDVQSIIKSYRVYLLFMPKIEIVAAADRMVNIADQMSSLSAKLQTRIDMVKTAGNDVSSLQTLLDDMKAKIADANTQAANATSAVISLTPDGYPANKTVLQSARTTLRTGYQDLISAFQDAKNIRKGMETFMRSKTGTPSANFMRFKASPSAQ